MIESYRRIKHIIEVKSTGSNRVKTEVGGDRMDGPEKCVSRKGGFPYKFLILIINEHRNPVHFEAI
jgi:hypothetical protein